MRLLDALAAWAVSIQKESPRKGGGADVHDYFPDHHPRDYNPLDIHRYSRLSPTMTRGFL